MKIYYSTGDVSDGDIPDICEKEYHRLIEFCFSHCEKFALYFPVSILKDVSLVPIAPIERRVNPLIDPSYARFVEKSYLYFFPCTPESKRYLLDTVDSLFQWCTWTDHNPEDLEFYRADGSLFFWSIGHEGACGFELQEGEDASAITSNSGWTCISEE